MFDVTLLIALGLAALGFISHNTTVAVSNSGADYCPRNPVEYLFPGLKNGTHRRDYHIRDHRVWLPSPAEPTAHSH